jgi:hypothetical protein
VAIRVDCLLLADAAQEVGGKLFVLGGGWNRLRVAELPARAPAMALAIRVIVPWHDTNQPIPLVVHLEDPDGQRLLAEPPRLDLRVGRPSGLEPGSDQVIPVAISLAGFPLKVAGTHAFVALLGNEELARTTFDVIVAKR